MKKITLVTLVAFVSLSACREEKFNQEDPAVTQFVELLLRGEYDSQQPIPDFRPDQISALLFYADDPQTIPSFPVNPISSLWVEEYRLGECMLWTIESIRLAYGEPITSPQRYPSLNPILSNEAAQRPDRRATLAELQLAYQAYVDWWYDASTDSFEQKRTINPLENTLLSWR